MKDYQRVRREAWAAIMASRMAKDMVESASSKAVPIGNDHDPKELGSEEKPMEMLRGDLDEKA